MSIIAWDGKSVAVDTMVVWGDLRRHQGKARWIKNPLSGNPDLYLVAYTGGVEEGKTLLNWFENGGNWPEFQADKDRWACLVTFNCEDGKVQEYNQLPMPFDIPDPFMAWGSGREVAIGALSHGATAIEAVQTACQWRIDCGPPIEEYDLRLRSMNVYK